METILAAFALAAFLEGYSGRPVKVQADDC